VKVLYSFIFVTVLQQKDNFAFKMLCFSQGEEKITGCQ